MNTELIVAEPKDVDLLHQVCTTAYTQHFADHWEPGRLEWYLDQSFKTRLELSGFKEAFKPATMMVKKLS